MSISSSRSESRAAGSGAEPLFGPDALQAFERIRLALRRVAPTLLRGEHRARRYGRGVEFSDYRPYVDGDDERDVDWPAYLRSDKLLVRRFEEEGDLRIYLFLDRSRSMATPGVLKFDLARRLAAVLTYIALTQHDRVYLLPFTGGVEQPLLDLRGRESIHRVLDHLTRLEAGGESRLADAIDGFFSRPRRRGLVVLLSDFLFPLEDPLDGPFDGPFERLATLDQTVLAVHVRDAWAPPEGTSEPLLLVDAESGDELELHLSSDAAVAYRAAVAEHAGRVAHRCRGAGVVLHAPEPGEPLEKVVLDLFRATEWL